MSEIDSVDWDGSTAAAWTMFQARLADLLAEMEDDDIVLLEAEASEQDEGAAPYVQICAWGDGRLRCEAVSNTYLAPAHQLDAAAHGVLMGLGYAAPTWRDAEEADSGSSNFWIDLASGDADRAAVLATRTLRDVYGVVHPAFVTGLPGVEGETVCDIGSLQPAPSEEPAVFPADGREQLLQLVDDALTPFFGHVPVHDKDGDIPVTNGDAVAFVRVLEDRPVVRIFACLAAGFSDRRRAQFEVGVLNRDLPHFKFVLRGEAVFLEAEVLGWPFAGEHLRHLLAQLCGFMGQVRDDLTSRLGAEEDTSADGDEDDDLHPAMSTLLELDAADPGSVDAALAASICDYDRDLVLRLLTWNAEQEIAWRQAWEEAVGEEDEDLAIVCAGELERAERTTALLRAALRVVVERRAARYERDRARRHGTRRSLPPKPRRRAPDPTLEEVDPEMWNR